MTLDIVNIMSLLAKVITQICCIFFIRLIDYEHVLFFVQDTKKHTDTETELIWKSIIPVFPVKIIKIKPKCNDLGG
jgi:hypothetical protein